MRKRQFIGLVVLGIIFIAFKIYFNIVSDKKKNIYKAENIEFITIKNSSFVMENFNPNDLDLEGWKKLGFSEKQAKSILNYKEKVYNGNFTSKEEIKNCFAISEDKFNEINQYILLPDKNEKIKVNDIKDKKYTGKLNIYRKINPNDLTVDDWEKIGFSRAQSESILKYKNFLGGNFQSKENLKECFVISEEEFNQLSPFLLFPKENREKNQNISLKITEYFDPNELDLSGWQNLGFSEKQAKSILNYKEKTLRGKFNDISDVKNSYVISDKKFQEIEAWIKFKNNDGNIKIISDTIKNNEKTQIIELNSVSFVELKKFGFSEKTCANFISFRKKLGGFAIKKQIMEVYSIDKNLAQKLIDESELNTENVIKIDILSDNENTLRNHPYFRKYAEKIVFYRISYNNKEKLIKKLGIPNNDLEKIKLYLK